MEDFSIHFNQSTLHYIKVGSGSKAMIAFHGFGQNSHSFTPLAKRIAHEYTCYAVDLFFHGKSTRKSCELPIRLSELKDLMDELLKRHAIQQFSLTGYSLGGKFVMAILNLFPARIERMILIAPDGIKTNFWYKAATYPYLSRSIFKYTIDRPALFFRMISFLQQCGILHKRVAKFAESQMKTQEQRQRVYCSWIAFRKLAVDLDKNIKLLNEHHISLSLFFGRYDRVIYWKEIVPMLSKVQAQQLVILDKGHNTLLCDVAEYYLQHPL